MRWVVAGTLLVSALAGCLSGSDSSDASRPIGAPEWQDGQWWSWSATSHSQATSSDPSPSGPHDEWFNATVRDEVLRANVPTRYGPVALLLGNFSNADGPESDENLFASSPGNFSTLHMRPWAATACSAADVCLPPLAATLDPPGSPLFKFPLIPGQNWRYESQTQGSDAVLVAAVIGASTIDGPHGPMNVAHVAIRIWYNSTAAAVGAEYSFSDAEAFSVDYAPAVGHFVNVVGGATFRGSYTDGDKPTVTEEGTSTFAEHIQDWGVSTPTPLSDIVARLKIPSTAPSIPSPATTLQVTLAKHPETFEKGQSWTFQALRGASSGSDAAVTWTAYLEQAGKSPKPLATGRGDTFAYTFAQPGAYTIVAQPVDALNRTAGSPASAQISVSWHLKGAGTCKAGVSPIVKEDPTLCTGLSAVVPPGIFLITGKATYATGEAALPCSFIALYKDGAEASRNYAWPNLAAEDSSIATNPATNSTWEVRWVPSATAGSTVQYELAIQPVSSAATPGGNGC